MKRVLCLTVLFLGIIGGALATYGGQLNVALLVTPPGKADVGWNFVHWLGCERAKDLGLVREYAEIISTEADALSNLTMLAQSNEYDLIFVAGWEFLDPLKVVAQEFPDQNFVLTDIRMPSGYPNVLNILFQQEQPSCLVGALAALLAVHHDYPHVGIVLGKEGPVLYEFEMGYKYGVNWAMDWLAKEHPDLLEGKAITETLPKERVLWTYTGTWSDPGRGREATEIQVQQGAAAVYAVAGATGLGVLNYIADYHREENVPLTSPPFAIGVDIAQDWMNPYIVASAMKRADVGVITACKLVLAGEFRDHPVLWMNLSNEGVWMSDEETLRTFIDYMIQIGELDPGEQEEIMTDWKALRAAQPAWIWEGIEELKAAIVANEVAVPRPFGEPEKWKIEDLREKYG